MNEDGTLLTWAPQDLRALKKRETARTPGEPGGTEVALLAQSTGALEASVYLRRGRHRAAIDAAVLCFLLSF